MVDALAKQTLLMRTGSHLKSAKAIAYIAGGDASFMTET